MILIATESNKKRTEKFDENPERVMPFLDHIEELRMRLLRTIISLLVATIICYFFIQDIMAFLIAPFPGKLHFLAPQESFVMHIKVAIFAGLFLSLPYILFQLWQFVFPGLLEKERKFIPLIVFFSTLFFLIGATFCYTIIIRFGLEFLLSWQNDALIPTITIREYLKLVTLLIIVFGFVFELPLLSYFLTKMGLLTSDFLRKNRRYGIVITFVLAAILTPPDVITQIMLAIPLIILYEISIWVSKFVSKQQNQVKDE